MHSGLVYIHISGARKSAVPIYLHEYNSIPVEYIYNAMAVCVQPIIVKFPTLLS